MPETAYFPQLNSRQQRLLTAPAHQKLAAPEPWGRSKVISLNRSQGVYYGSHFGLGTGSHVARKKWS
jgi:hypothetical protein